MGRPVCSRRRKRNAPWSVPTSPADAITVTGRPAIVVDLIAKPSGPSASSRVSQPSARTIAERAGVPTTSVPAVATASARAKGEPSSPALATGQLGDDDALGGRVGTGDKRRERSLVRRAHRRILDPRVPQPQVVPVLGPRHSAAASSHIAQSSTAETSMVQSHETES